MIDRLSADLKEEFPEMDGFSARNLGSMKRFASIWPDPQILQQAVAKLQWRSILTLLTNDILRHPDDKPTIGLLLVKGKNRTVVEYSLSGYTNPIGVADWANGITAAVPDDLKSSLPTIEEIEREMEYVEAQVQATITDEEN